MAETVTLEFLARQLDRVITDQAAMRDDIRVLTTIALRDETTLTRLDETMQGILSQMRAMVAQHQRFNDRLRRLEEQPAQ